MVGAVGLIASWKHTPHGASFQLAMWGMLPACHAE